MLMYFNFIATVLLELYKIRDGSFPAESFVYEISKYTCTELFNAQIPIEQN